MLAIRCRRRHVLSFIVFHLCVSHSPSVYIYYVQYIYYIFFFPIMSRFRTVYSLPFSFHSFLFFVFVPGGVNTSESSRVVLLVIYVKNPILRSTVSSLVREVCFEYKISHCSIGEIVQSERLIQCFHRNGRRPIYRLQRRRERKKTNERLRLHHDNRTQDKLRKCRRHEIRVTYIVL